MTDKLTIKVRQCRNLYDHSPHEYFFSYKNGMTGYHAVHCKGVNPNLFRHKHILRLSDRHNRMHSQEEYQELLEISRETTSILEALMELSTELYIKE